MEVNVVSNTFANGVSESTFVGPTVVSWDAIDKAMNDNVGGLRPDERNLHSAFVVISINRENRIDHRPTFSDFDEIFKVLNYAAFMSKFTNSSLWIGGAFVFEDDAKTSMQVGLHLQPGCDKSWIENHRRKNLSIGHKANKSACAACGSSRFNCAEWFSSTAVEGDYY